MFEVSALQHIFKLLYECKIIQDIFLSCVFLHRVKESLFFETIDYISDRFFKRFFLENQQLIAKCRWKQWREISTHVTTFSYIVWFKKESIDYIIFLLYCKNITTCLGLFENIFWHNTHHLSGFLTFFSQFRLHNALHCNVRKS